MPTDMMIIAAGKPKGGSPFGARGKERGGLPSPDPVGGRLKGQQALDEAGYHGSEATCGQCSQFAEPNKCRSHMAQVDPDFGHCDAFEGQEAPQEEVVEETEEGEAVA